MSKASESARLLGRRGGRARAARLSAADKRRIASLGGKARLESLEAERRIISNFEYAAALDELRGVRSRAIRLRRFAGRLPGSTADEA